MDLIAINRLIAGQMVPADPAYDFVRYEFRCDIEMPKTIIAAGMTFDAFRIINCLTEDLVATAQSQDMAAAPDVRCNVDVPSFFAEGDQIAYGAF